MAEVLIIDGDAGFAAELAAALSDAAGHGTGGMEVRHCHSLAQGLAQLHRGAYKALILADNLPDGDALDHMPNLAAIAPRPEVLFLTGAADPDAAERAIRDGAWHVMPKPPNMPRLRVILERMLAHHASFRRARPVALRREGIVGNSRPLENCLDEVALAAAGEANVLITGETGTGKELFARAIHKNSARRKRPFVVVDCAAMPETLVESVLFGHEKGAFTSADARRVGLITQADGGALFLDEVGELPLSMQKVFLRVLEGRAYRPVGGAQELTSDFRLIAATNRDLPAMAADGGFRKDLLYRLQGLTISLPRLTAMTNDLEELVCHGIRTYCRRLGVEAKGFSPDFLESLALYDWPGNVRELLHTLEHAVGMAGDEDVLFPRHLPRTIRAQIARRSMLREETAEHTPARGAVPEFKAEDFPSLRRFREKLLADGETRYLRGLMALAEGDMARACELADLSKPRLYALLKEREVAKG